ncbi:MAG: T9SS type A sorting domain-containing protein, partial [Lewinella sp.]
DTLPSGSGPEAGNCTQSAVVGASFESPFVPQESLLDGGEATSVTLFPNPVKTDLTIQVRSPYEGRVEMRIYDATGRAISHQEIDKTGDQLKVILDAVDLPPGTYRSVIVEGDRTTVSSFVKLR